MNSRRVVSFFVECDFHPRKRENVGEQRRLQTLVDVSGRGAGVLTQSAKRKCKECMGNIWVDSLRP